MDRRPPGEKCRLASIYAIDIAADAIMINHYHLVHYIDRDHGMARSDTEVIERWRAPAGVKVLVAYRNCRA
ncbi:MAG: hypothetical protein HKP12_06150 [Gammaproteobacteria bacterium]|nr:hypothetical protein [Gammaproteobacteria bacterium]